MSKICIEENAGGANAPSQKGSALPHSGGREEEKRATPCEQRGHT